MHSKIISNCIIFLVACKISILLCFISVENIYEGCAEGEGLSGDFPSPFCSGSLVKWNTKTTTGSQWAWQWPVMPQLLWGRLKWPAIYNSDMIERYRSHTMCSI